MFPFDSFNNKVKIASDDADNRVNGGDPDDSGDPNDPVRLLIDNALDYAVFTTDQDGVLETWNPGVESILGYTRDEWIGKDVRVIFTPEDRENRVPEAEMTQSRTKGRADDTRWHVKRDGSRFWADGAMSPLYDDDQNLRGYGKIMRDATARKRSEDALLRAETELAARARDHAALVNTTNDSLVRYDRNLRFVFVNPAFERATGLTFGQVVGKTLSEAGFPPEAVAEWEAVLRGVFATGEPRRLEGVLTVPVTDGARAFERDIVPEFDPSGNGEVATVLTFSRDITARKKAERRERLLSDISERLRVIAEPEDALYQTAKAVGEFTNANRCLYGEISAGGEIITLYRDFVQGDGVASIKGTYPLPGFGPQIVAALHAGNITKVENTDTDVRLDEISRATFRTLNFRAFLCVPLHKEGRWVSMLALHSATPRVWTSEEEELLAIVVERTWLAVENTRLYRAMQDEVEERRTAEARLADAYARERVRAERETILSEASRILSASLGYEETLTATARLITPRFADWCGVDLVGEGGAVQRVAVEHVEPEKAAWGWEVHRLYPLRPDASHGVAAVLRTGEPEFAPVITDAMLTLAAQDEEHGRLLRSIGFTSVMIVPLVAGGVVFGAISFVATEESNRTYTPDDLLFAEEIGRRAALAIQNARLFQAVQEAERKQRGIAETLQRSLLLAPPPGAFPGLSLFPYYEAATDESLIGGDLYDVVNLENGQIALVVGDATGKSLAAAIEVADYKFSLRAYLRLENTLEGALQRMNQHLLDRQNLDGKPRTSLLCLTIALVDSETGAATVGAAGAEPPLIFRAVTGETEEVAASGSALGAFPEWFGDIVTTQLEPGDALLLYTDGLTEARRGKRSPDFFGIDGVRNALQTAALLPASLEQTATAIVAEAKAFASGALGDDVCLLLARREELS